MTGRRRFALGESRAGARARTPRELLPRLGRLALWLAVGLVLVRGIGSVTTTEGPPARPRVTGVAAAVWPDDAARAFAVAFVGAYLTHSPADDPGADARRLDAFVSRALVGQLAPQYAEHAPRHAVQSATVAGSVRVDDRHALVTVAATVAAPAPGTRLVTVPVARDNRGGLVVYDLPSFAPMPGRAAAGPTLGEPLLGPERAAIADVLTRFLRAYLAGDTGGLRYLVPPGTRIAAAAGRLELVELASIAAAGPARRDGRLVLATVHARDARSRAMYGLRYRVRLVRRDRWYVADLNGRGGWR